MSTSDTWMPNHAMVLAAGKGTRLRPYTDHCPKPMVKAGGKTLIDHALDHLQNAGVPEVSVNIHYKGDMLAEHLSKRATPQLHLVHEKTLMDTGGGIKNALPTLGTDAFFVVSGDSLWTDDTTPALKRMAQAWDDEKMDLLLLMQPVDTMTLTKGIGDYTINKDGRGVRSIERTGTHMWTSIRICSHRLFKDTPDEPFSFLKLMDRAESQGRLYTLVHDGDWHHITTAEDLDRINDHLSQGKECA